MNVTNEFGNLRPALARAGAAFLFSALGMTAVYAADP
jgi:hypothetical protein